jgi:hypothetical protein
MDKNTMIVVCIGLLGFFILIGVLSHDDTEDRKACYAASVVNPSLKCKQPR